jgi:hypothetical protein
MTGALLYLTLCSMRNFLWSRLRRLRQPRYLIATTVGGLYFYFLVLNPRGGSSRGPSGGPLAFIGRFGESMELLGGTLLFVIAALAWVLPRSREPALAFSRAEVQFLFTAPVTRRQLIQYKLLRSALGTVLSAAFITLVFRSSSAAGRWMFFIGMVVMMQTLSLHLTGVSLSRKSLAAHGLAGLARQWLPLAIVVVAVVALGGTVAADWGRLSSLHETDDVLDELRRLGASPPVAIVLWPFRALVRLPLASSPGELLAALPSAVLLLALNFVWVIRSDAAFEEASAELAEKMAHARRTAGIVPFRARQAPFTLSLTGPIETALFWKNLILLGRYASSRMLLRLIPAIIVLVAFAGGVLSARRSEGEAPGMPAIFCAIGVIFVIFIGPQMVRNDLRQDLAQLAILKTWPVRGAALVRGEVLAPTMVLSSLAWLLVTAAVALSSPFLAEASTAARTLAGVAGVLLIAPGLIALQLIAVNGFAVFFPAWVTIGANRAGGIEAGGQRLLMMVGLLIVVGVAALPAGTAAAVVGLAIYAANGTKSIFLPALAATIVLLVECVIATEAIGRVLDRTDISDVPAGE